MNVLGFITMSAAAAAAAPAAAPIVTVAPPPPPPPRIIETARGRWDAQSAVVDVAVTAGRETLWSGRVRVGNGGAEYTQSLRQSPEPCPGESDAGSRHAVNSQQLNVRIDARRSSERVHAFSLRVNWERPLPGCEGGSRGVSLNQQVDIAPGETVRLSGDAGLIVTLTRRSD